MAHCTCETGQSRTALKGQRERSHCVRRIPRGYGAGDPQTKRGSCLPRALEYLQNERAAATYVSSTRPES
jgi:hypothetical protein